MRPHKPALTHLRNKFQKIPDRALFPSWRRKESRLGLTFRVGFRRMARNLLTTASLSRHFKRFMWKYSMAYLFLLVPLVAMVAFLFIPMVVSFWWSLNDYTGLQPPQFVGPGQLYPAFHG